ncbi:MAG: site-2 protease family protein [Candidatus Diapherotrites archaeon]|nr:site-2 protease family protein [Candidatus Diapherotrites archaeon]
MDNKELSEILISWLTISLAFAILLGRLNSSNIISIIPIALFAVGTGFVFHELAHRNVAKYFGVHAEYRLWWPGLIFTIFSAFLGFIFAAPGAVYVFNDHRIGKRENGIISAAGPATNILIGIILLFLSLTSTGFFEKLFLFSARMNFYLAFFNLLPFFILDGVKVFMWDLKIWAILFSIALIGSFVI